MLLLCVLPHSAVNVTETPVVATVEKKEYVYETKEEAKQAFKELLREKASLMYGPVIQCNIEITKGYEVRATMIEGQNSFSQTLRFA